MTVEVQQLEQLASKPICDGDILSKSARDKLCKFGYVDRTYGWNFLTKKGIETCIDLGLLRS